jgi:hypothetical protein
MPRISCYEHDFDFDFFFPNKEGTDKRQQHGPRVPPPGAAEKGSRPSSVKSSSISKYSIHLSPEDVVFKIIYHSDAVYPAQPYRLPLPFSYNKSAGTAVETSNTAHIVSTFPTNIDIAE